MTLKKCFTCKYCKPYEKIHECLALVNNGRFTGHYELYSSGIDEPCKLLGISLYERDKKIMKTYKCKYCGLVLPIDKGCACMGKGVVHVKIDDTKSKIIKEAIKKDKIEVALGKGVFFKNTFESNEREMCLEIERRFVDLIESVLLERFGSTHNPKKELKLKITIILENVTP